jgi:hypothetical protein
MLLIKGLRTCLWEKTAGNALTQGKELCSLAAKSLLSCLSCIKVVLTSLTSYQLPVLGNLNALTE